MFAGAGSGLDDKQPEVKNDDKTTSQCSDKQGVLECIYKQKNLSSK